MLRNFHPAPDAVNSEAENQHINSMLQLIIGKSRCQFANGGRLEWVRNRFINNSLSIKEKFASLKSTAVFRHGLNPALSPFLLNCCTRTNPMLRPSRKGRYLAAGAQSAGIVFALTSAKGFGGQFRESRNSEQLRVRLQVRFRLSHCGEKGFPGLIGDALGKSACATFRLKQESAKELSWQPPH